MAGEEGRAPRPRRGDPNTKAIHLALRPEDWRKLRVWAAEEDTTLEAVVEEIVRRELAVRPRQEF